MTAVLGYKADSRLATPDHAPNSLSSPKFIPPMAWVFIEYRVYTSNMLTAS